MYNIIINLLILSLNQSLKFTEYVSGTLYFFITLLVMLGKGFLALCQNNCFRKITLFCYEIHKARQLDKDFEEMANFTFIQCSVPRV